MSRRNRCLLDGEGIAEENGGGVMEGDKLMKVVK